LSQIKTGIFIYGMSGIIFENGQLFVNDGGITISSTLKEAKRPRSNNRWAMLILAIKSVVLFTVTELTVMSAQEKLTVVS
jgi:hypothetical protein